MKIKAMQSFVNGVSGESYQATHEYETKDVFGAELVKAGLAVEVKEPVKKDEPKLVIKTDKVDVK